MSKSIVLAACAAILAGTILPSASPAAAGDRHHHPEIVRYGHVPWYHQEPWIGTGPGYYYSQHPDHIPAYPKPLTGYAVPIYDSSPPVVRLAPRYRGHEEWCAARYRSYDARSGYYRAYSGRLIFCG